MSKIKSVVVIGLGTLGGFLCESLSKIESIKIIQVIDYDEVTEENLGNSIYSSWDLGKFKIDCIREIIKKSNSKVFVYRSHEKYIEGENSYVFISHPDLVFDCRDFTYDRGTQIDVRPYISSRYLILDCRKNVKYEDHYEGMYTTQLTKLDLRNAATIIATLVQSGTIMDLVEKQVVHKIELDYIQRKTSEILERKGDELIDLKGDPAKFLNLPECLDRILDLNKRDQLMVYLGDKENSLITKKIPKNSLKTFEDVSSCLSRLTQLPFKFNYFVMFVKSTPDGKEFYIEIIPETGAA